MKKTARKAREPERVEKKEAKKPGEQEAPVPAQARSSMEEGAGAAGRDGAVGGQAAQGYFHLPLCRPFTATFPSEQRSAGKDEKLGEAELQAGKIQTAKLSCHFPAASSTVIGVSRRGFWVDASEDGS